MNAKFVRDLSGVSTIEAGPHGPSQLVGRQATIDSGFLAAKLGAKLLLELKRNSIGEAGLNLLQALDHAA